MEAYGGNVGLALRILNVGTGYRRVVYLGAPAALTFYEIIAVPRRLLGSRNKRINNNFTKETLRSIFGHPHIFGVTEMEYFNMHKIFQESPLRVQAMAALIWLGLISYRIALIKFMLNV